MSLTQAIQIGTQIEWSKQAPTLIKCQWDGINAISIKTIPMTIYFLVGAYKRPSPSKTSNVPLIKLIADL